MAPNTRVESMEEPIGERPAESDGYRIIVENGNGHLTVERQFEAETLVVGWLTPVPLGIIRAVLNTFTVPSTAPVTVAAPDERGRLDQNHHTYQDFMHAIIEIPDPVPFVRIWLGEGDAPSVSYATTEESVRAGQRLGLPPETPARDFHLTIPQDGTLELVDIFLRQTHPTAADLSAWPNDPTDPPSEVHAAFMDALRDHVSDFMDP